MTTTIRNWIRTGALALSMLASGTAFAVDGVLEINQTCAVLSGCMAGDSPGFPVTVGTRGMSVRLTGTLTVANDDTTAIEVTATNVTVDLNGFAIVGPNDNHGAPVSTCPTTGGPTPFGTGRGIDASGIQGVTVRNGTVRGMGEAGVTLGALGRVEDLLTTDNGGPGIAAQVASLVARSLSGGNCSDGIIVGEGSVVLHSVSRSNNLAAVNAVSSALIGNVATRNRVTISAPSSGVWHSRANENVLGDTMSGITEEAPNFCGGTSGTDCNPIN